MNEKETAPLPEAVIRPVAGHWAGRTRLGLLWWLLPAAAALLVAHIVFLQPILNPAVNVSVDFSEGAGVAKGDKVRFLDIDLGHVERISLVPAPDSSGVTVRVGLKIDREYLQLVTEDSVFWIEKPVIGLGGVRGLDTLTRGSYVGFRPGLSRTPAREFTGEKDPPPSRVISPDGLLVILENQEKAGLVPGAFINFRGFKVGQVESVSLSGDSSTVESRAYIFPEYKNLVRDNTIFWPDSEFKTAYKFMGSDMSLGLKVPGFVGVSLSTPTEAGAPVKQGGRFRLKSVEETKRAEVEWLSYKPNIPLAPEPDGTAGPLSPVRPVALSWQEAGKLWGKNRKSAQGWALEPSPGVLLMSATIWEAPLRGGDLALSLGGREIKAADFEVSGDDFLKVVRLAKGGERAESAKAQAIGSDLFFAGGETADCAIAYRARSGPDRVMKALLRKEKLVVEGPNWRIATEVPIPPGTEHAPVLVPASGKIVGFLEKDARGFLVRRRP